MTRHLRVEYSGALYHITARGNERKSIFHTIEDRKHFLEVLEEALERYEVHLFAYVLMNNHYHLVIQTEHPNLSRFMHWLNSAYTVWMNTRNQRRGHLFEGRYKAIVMEDEGYLLSVTGYVHMNPVRIRGWKEKPVEERLARVKGYAWSSFGAYTKASSREPEPEVSCDRVWGELGAGNQREGRKRYHQYIRGWLKKEAIERKKPKKKRDEEALNPFLETRLGCFIGGDQFRDFIQGLLMKDKEVDQGVVGYKEWRQEKSVEEILSAVVEVRGVRLEDLMERRWEHMERDLAMYLCRECGEKSLKETGEALGVGVAAVGHAITRVKSRMKQEKRFKKVVDKAKEKIIRILEA